MVNIFFYIISLVLFIIYFLTSLSMDYNFSLELIYSFIKEFQFIKFVVEDPDSVTIKEVNKKIDGMVSGVKNISVLVGGVYAIKTVVDAIPHKGGKVIVGSVGLGTLFVFSHIEHDFCSSMLPLNNFGYEVPSDLSPEALETFKWMFPFCVESIFVLSIILFIQLDRKFFIKWIFETQQFKDWFDRYKHLVPTWFTKQASTTSESISQIYIGIICILLLTNLTNVLLILMVLKKNMEFFATQLGLAITMSLWCYIPMSLLIIEVFKCQILRYLFGYKGLQKPIQMYYVAFLIMSIIIIISYIFSIMVKLLFN